jgi:hypothetical protein
MSDRLAVANAIDAGIERAKAECVATHDNVATKADLQALGAELKAAFAAEAARLDTGSSGWMAR